MTTYPVDGQTQVRKIMSDEQPFPLLLSDIPKDAYGNFDLAHYSSYPISISIPQDQTLTMTSMTVTEEGQTTALPMRVLQKSNDQAVFSSNIFFVGYQPFKAQTKYNVVFIGAANGVSFTKKFSFTTA